MEVWRGRSEFYVCVDVQIFVLSRFIIHITIYALWFSIYGKKDVIQETGSEL